MQEIFQVLPGLFQGSHLPHIPQNIKAVINVSDREAIYNTSALTAYAHLSILDGARLADGWLETALDIVGSFRKREWPVFIHCQAGMSRSVFLTAAQVIKETGVTPKDAIKMINDLSGFADPAPNFVLALEEFHKGFKR